VLQIFLTGDCVVDVLEALEVDETVDVVSLGEAVGYAVAVLLEAAVEVVGYADVERAREAGEDVDEVVVFLRHSGRISEKQILRLRRRMTSLEGMGVDSVSGGK